MRGKRKPAQIELEWTSTTTEFSVRDRRSPGWFWVDNEIVEAFGYELKMDGIGMYAFMCRKANNATGEVRLSIRKIAALSSTSVGHVYKLLTRILGLGLAKQIRPGGNWGPAVYVLADVKELLARRKSVQTVNTEEPDEVAEATSGNVHNMNIDVHIVNGGVHHENSMFTEQTPYKEVKTKDGKTSDTERLLGVEGRDFEGEFLPVSSSTAVRPIAGIATPGDVGSPSGKTDNLQSTARDLDQWDRYLPTNSQQTAKLPEQDQASSSLPHPEPTESAINFVLAVFEESPVTKSKTSEQDRQIARDLLRKFSPENIERGILFGTVNRISSLLRSADTWANGNLGQAKIATTPVQSLNYFVNSILETMNEGQFTPQYMEYVRGAIQRHAPRLQALWDKIKSQEEVSL